MGWYWSGDFFRGWVLVLVIMSRGLYVKYVFVCVVCW